MKKIFLKDAIIGDVIARDNAAYGQMTVVNVREEDGRKIISLFRPYVSLGNFIYAGGAIPYIGTECFDTYVKKEDNYFEYLYFGNIYRGEKP